MNASEIDYTSPDFWAKAPADATHFGPENDERFPAWYKCVDGEWMCFLVRGRQEWTDALDCEIKAPMIQRPRFAHEHGAQPAEKTTALHAQAQALEDAAARMAQGGEWDGKGLPPVGTVCEVNHRGWRRCEVFAHKVEGDNDPDVLFSYTKDNGEPAWNWARDPSRFRPIRTPEQIAAEEREKAITEMWMCISEDTPLHTKLLKQACADLYDAGYRKAEGEKQ